MKLLVATETGRSPTTDPDNPGPLAGELLFPAEQCDKAHCMCRREFVSVTTYERTMHARVVELDITEDQIRDIARDYVVATSGDEDPDEIDAYVRDLIEPAELAGRHRARTVGIRTTRPGRQHHAHRRCRPDRATHAPPSSGSGSPHGLPLESWRFLQ